MSQKLFTRLALATSLLTLGLIVFGAVVRVTDSGLGCGNSWPLCDGTILPPFDNVTAWIEWLHRLFALLIGVLGLSMLFVAWRTYRKEKRLVLNATIVAAVLFFIQSALGAITVIFDLPPTVVTLHLATAMLLLAALLLATVGAWYRPTIRYVRDHVTMLVYVTTGLSLVIILTGALVRGSGATLACTDWPLCNGQIFPAQGRLELVHMTHRYAVAALGLTLLLVVWYVLQTRQDRNSRSLAVLALVAYVAQAGVGALYVFSLADPIWGAAHVGLAAATWALLVGLSIIETLNSQGQVDGEYNPTTVSI
jgi:heme A synthase